MHEQLQNLLKLTGDVEFPDASELHGVLCAHALQPQSQYGHAALELGRWLDLPATDQAVLAAALAEEHAALIADSMDYQLYLPADSTSLGQRTQALAAWCGGFVSGMGVYEEWLPETPVGLPQQTLKQAPDAMEAIHDLSEIARANAAHENADETEEQAYAEILEYVRVAVQLIQTALPQPAQAGTSQPALH